MRQELDFVRAIGTAGGQQLFKQGLEQEIDSIRGEIQQPTDRTVQRVTLCLDYKENLPAGSLDDALIKAMDSKTGEALRIWLGIIEHKMAGLEPSFPNRFAVRCLEIVPSIPEQRERQEVLLEAFIGVFVKLSPDERRPALREFFALMKDPQSGTRSAAASNLKELREASSENQDFKLAVANVIKYLRDEIKTGELPAFERVFDALLTDAGLLGEYPNRDLADMAKALMSQNNDSLQELGLRLIEQMPVIPNDDQAEVIHLLIGIATSSSGLKDRATDRLGLFSPEKIVDSARQELEGWLNSRT